MPKDRETWLAYGDEYDWKPPKPGAWWKRLPIVRWFRYVKNRIMVECHYSFGAGQFGLRSGYDDWVLYGVYHGWV